MKLLAIVAVVLSYFDRSRADCMAVYFHFDDGIRRPVYPVEECATYTSGGMHFSYRFECVTRGWEKVAIKAKYNGTSCKGTSFEYENVTTDWIANTTQYEVQCDEDPCDYAVITVSDECDADVYEDIYVVNECIEYEDEGKSEEWSCGGDGVTITYWDGDECFGSGAENGTAKLTDTIITYNHSACYNVSSCDEWAIDCATENSAACAYCAQFAPCISSVDPHCISHEALGCLDCKHYAECAVCAPGWDEGCIAMEWHQNYSCSSAELVVDNETISIPSRMDGQCHYNAIWEQFMKSDCKSGNFSNDCNSDCSNCSEHSTFSPSTAYDVQITDPLNAVCVNYTETDDETNETEYKSMNVYGHCSHREMSCPDGNSCGPESCSTNTSSDSYDAYCIEIEVFDENTTCEASAGAGDYTAFAIADNVCRMDGSGRSYYALQCAEGVFYGVIGCLDCLCSDNCTDIVAANEGAKGLDGYAPNTCYQYNITDSLHLAGIVNETRLRCSKNRTAISIQPSCTLTYAPTSDPTEMPTLPTNDPTVPPTEMPSNDPTVAPTEMPTDGPTVPPSSSPTAGSPTMDTTSTSTSSTTPASNDTAEVTEVLATDVGDENTLEPDGGDGAGVVAVAQSAVIAVFVVAVAM